MKRTLISAAALAFLLTLAEPAAAQDLASSIVGVWKMTSFVRKEVATGKTINSYGQHPAGMVVYTKGGHFVAFVAAEDRKAPAKTDPTDAERIELFKTMFGFGGTYKIDGNKLILHMDTSWIQSWTGTDRPPAVVEIKEKQMTSTSSPFKSLDGQEIVVTATWQRAE